MSAISTRVRRTSWGEGLPWLLPPVAIVALLAPMLFTGRSFYEDWTNHLWLVWNQSEAVRRGGLPTLWTHTDQLGVYYPQFLFYGGTLFGLAGYVSALLGGHPLPAYLAFFVGAFAMAYGGWSWLAWQAGLRGWAAQLPGLVHVSAAAYVSTAYARSDWPELVATSTLPLIAASTWWLLRSPRWRPWPVAAFLVGALLLSGSHNISLVWGATFVALVSAVALVALGPGVGAIGTRRIAAVAGLALVAVAVNGWFLVPDLSLTSHLGAAPGHVDAYDYFNTAGLVLSPLPRSPDLALVTNGAERATTWPREYVQMPILALVWALIACAAILRRPGPGRRLVLGLLALLAFLLILVLRGDPAVGGPGRWLWPHLPHFLRYTQFALRLHAFVVPTVCGLVLVGLLAVRTWRPPRRALALGGLAAACAYMVGTGIWQAWVTPDAVYSDRGQVFAGSISATPKSWGDTGNYRDYEARAIAVPRARSIRLAPEAALRRLPSDAAAVPPGSGPIGTNLAAGPEIVRVAGLEPIGRLAAREDPGGFNPIGLMVVRRPRAADAAGPLPWSVARASGGPLLAGRLTTLVGLAGVVGLALLGARARRRPARRRRRA